MIRLPRFRLEAKVAKQLNAYQDEVLAHRGYTGRVAEAKRLFSRYNARKNATFASVKAVLTRMCSGARRCSYCEDSVADEVEHIWPKDLYPERVFVWDNYCYACGPCNGPKNNQFAVFVGASRSPTLLAHPKRKQGQTQPTLKKPATGKPVLLDPRKDDATQWLTLDILDTFQFVVTAKGGTRDAARARYTLEVLGLNRAPLPTARAQAFDGYRARLREYCEEKRAGASGKRLVLLRDALLRVSHPTVWVEMKRHRARVPALKSLFAEAPEALDWAPLPGAAGER
ncbi:aminoglycoside phosphotransferase [Corallococcus carmarthensis]|uniref:Aminoglycoside phosphotransferase n=1 Tax=Corallococcus carmarthensis TaxID=2316728 RepID=A0A3A8KHK4_9BACT|nr:aminoglycoside phosphotransferase [Corallococcus carmarthensis]NOK17598.1 aminoglycoside phosphotransferase [Corallococcus carmarthensis]RKH06807.1 aminoglycoside phosphotransferase [Corallococcus carmarthensis]